MMMRCHIYGKKNCQGPEGWENDDHAPWYDPDAHYGKEIPGALVNGYTEQEMRQYFKDIEGFSSYCFNKSHSQSYAYIAILTAWLKCYYPAQFMAAALSIGTEEDRRNYSAVCEQQMGLKIKVPDINISGEHFTASGSNILYGMGAVKGVGSAAIAEIIQHRPYHNVTEAVAKIPKKYFNKKIATALIYAGAFDFYEPNRWEVYNEYQQASNCVFDADKDSQRIQWIESHMEDKEDPTLSDTFKAAYGKIKRRRKVPELELLNIADWTPKACMEKEKETLGVAVTYKPWWDNVKPGQKISEDAVLEKRREHTDKRGRLMAFVNIRIRECEVDGVVFASRYCRFAGLLDPNFSHRIHIKGEKTDKGGIIINQVAPCIEETEEENIA